MAGDRATTLRFAFAYHRSRRRLSAATRAILAALKNGNHEAYRYPYTLRLVK